MSNFFEKMGITIEKSQAQSLELIDKLIATARPAAVFSSPITAGDYTVITAAEVGIGVGFASGGGGGSQPVEQQAADAEAQDQSQSGDGLGVGTGSGGASVARPVAVIIIGPAGVEVEPIVDATKIAIALFTTVGAMALMWSRMSKLGRKARPKWRA